MSSYHLLIEVLCKGLLQGRKKTSLGSGALCIARGGTRRGAGLSAGRGGGGGASRGRRFPRRAAGRPGRRCARRRTAAGPLQDLASSAECATKCSRIPQCWFISCPPRFERATSSGSSGRRDGQPYPK